MAYRWQILISSEECQHLYWERVDAWEENAEWCNLTNKRCNEDDCPRSLVQLIKSKLLEEGVG